MEKKIKTIGLILAVLALVLQPVFAAADTGQAVSYLKAQTQDAWITMALAAAGETGVATSHLTTVSGTLATDYAKVILALAAVNQNPATFGSVDYVAKLKTYYVDNQMGAATLLNDDFWSLLALASAGQKTSIEAAAAKNFILANQNADGGWGYAVGGDSDTNDTAAAIIALVEAGVGASDLKITNAVNYLKTAQNADGGIGYQPGYASDSGSDAWVISAIYKVGQTPATWDKSGNNPLSHLQTLQDTDGGFWWVAPGTSEWNNKAMTAFAVIALAQKSYPVGYYQPPAGTYHLRIEGKTATVCDAYVTAATALEIVQKGASICNYSYTITQESFGPYLRQIASDAASGMTGWLYFVNYISPPIGANDYILKTGEEVLWYYGDWGWMPTRLSADDLEVNANQTINLTAEYFNGTDWLPLPNAPIKFNGETRVADATGHLPLTIAQNGIYPVYIEMAGYVRSGQLKIKVGSTVSQTVGLTAEIDQTGGIVGGESIGLAVTPNQLNFGKLKPGQTNTQDVTLSNVGTVNLTTGANVTGDSLFLTGIKINSAVFGVFSSALAAGENKTAAVSLNVPANYLGSGVKTGELIFWAVAQ